MFSQIIFFFQMPKRDNYEYAQADFDFGQVHVIWWLSYCQVGEKISVEPCIIARVIFVSATEVNCIQGALIQYSDVTWASRRLELLATQVLLKQLVQTTNKETSKPPHHWPFVRAMHRSWKLLKRRFIIFLRYLSYVFRDKRRNITSLLRIIWNHTLFCFQISVNPIFIEKTTQTISNRTDMWIFPHCWKTICQICFETASTHPYHYMIGHVYHDVKCLLGTNRPVALWEHLI